MDHSALLPSVSPVGARSCSRCPEPGWQLWERALCGLAWDSAAAELGSGGLGPEKFPRLQEERPAAGLPGARMMAKLKPQERRRRLEALLPPLCQAAAPLSLVSDLTERQVFLSPSIPHGTELLITAVFFLIVPWSYALIYCFFRENLGKKMVVSQGNSGPPRAADYGQAGNWCDKRREGLCRVLPPPSLWLCLCCDSSYCPTTPAGPREGAGSPLQTCMASSDSSILPFRPQRQQIALNFLFILGRRDLIYSLKVQGGVLELSWWRWL